MKMTLNRFARIAMMWVMVCALAMPAYSQIKFGLRGGVDLNSMSFKDVDVSKSNRAGFFIGPTVRVSTPMFLSVDGSLLYNYRSMEIDDETRSINNLNIPINLRAGFGLLGIGAFVSAGPQFTFNLDGDSSFGDAATDLVNMDMKNTQLSLNFGVGVHVSHFEVGAYYNLPLGDTADFNVVSTTGKAFTSKTNTWSLALTYYF